MRLRSGKNDVPEGNVVPRLHKCVHAIARTTTGASYQLSLRPACATQSNQLRMSPNGMVRPCSCPASDESGKGLQRQRSTPCPKISTAQLP